MPVQPEHINWGVEDFERYHSGKMTEAEMHAIEKAALDDPFLEDALEGYAYTKTPVSDIEAIRERIWPEAGDKAPVVWFRSPAMSQLIKAAAVVIIFGGLGWLLFNNAKNKTAQNDAVPIAANKTSTPALHDSISKLYNLNDSAPIIAKVDPIDINSTLYKNQPANGTISAVESNGNSENNEYKFTAPAEKEEMARSESQAKDKSLIIVNPSMTSAAAPVRQQPGFNQGAGVFNKKTISADSTSKYNDFYRNAPLIAASQVRGRVVDNTGKPVPFATVQNATNRQGVAADADGNFILNNDVANNNVKIEVNATGYEPAQSLLNNNSANNTIVLNQSQNVLSETVVTSAYNTKRKTLEADAYADAKANGKKEKYEWNGRNSRIQLRNASPLEGWDYFYYVMNDSIQKNKQLKQQQGRIILQFETDTLGTVKNVVVKKSLNDSADNAAMRILYRSPVLQIKSKQNKGEATIKLGL